MTPTVPKALARALRSAASILAAISPLERDLRVLATTLDENETPEPKGRPRRAAAEPRATVDFTPIDAKRAERALSRLGFRRES